MNTRRRTVTSNPHYQTSKTEPIILENGHNNGNALCAALLLDLIRITAPQNPEPALACHENRPALHASQDTGVLGTTKTRAKL